MRDPYILKRLLNIDRGLEQPVYLQITNAFIQNIRKGRLRKGLKLPGSRKVANLIGVNRMTIISAYDELYAQGWVERIPRKGTFVSHDLPEIKPRDISEETKAKHFPKNPSFSLSNDSINTFPSSNYQKAGVLKIDNGFPDARLAPVQSLIRNLRTLSQQPVFNKYLNYGGPRGTKELRETLSRHLSDTRALPISPENILITRGAQMGIYLTSSLLLQPGDQVVVGEPGYFNANQAFHKHQADIHPVPVDEFGMDIDALEKICKQKPIRMVYVIPHHHFPTTVTLIPKRRLKLLELAEKYSFAIIEDDYDYDFHYTSSPMLPMASLARKGNVVYVGTLTKTMAPSIRIGFIIGSERFIDALANLRRTIDWQGDSLMEMAIAELYKDGTIARHIKKSVKIYRQRRDHFCTLLEAKLGSHISFDIPDGGMSVWAKFTDVNLKNVSQEAYKKGLVISDGVEYNTRNKNYNSARLGFASLNFKEQEEAIDILINCIKDVNS